MVEIKKILHDKIYYYEQLDSTNLKALELAKQGAAEGTIVIAARQTAGLGELWVVFSHRVRIVITIIDTEVCFKSQSSP